MSQARSRAWRRIEAFGMPDHADDALGFTEVFLLAEVMPAAGDGHCARGRGGPGASWRVCPAGRAPALRPGVRELVKPAKEAFDCHFSIVFGQTELHGVITQTLLDDSPADQSRTIGRPLHACRV